MASRAWTAINIRDNGSGQIWSASKRIGSINYWTEDVVLEKKFVPKVRFRDILLILLGLKSAALPNVSCEYEVSDLSADAITGQHTTRTEVFPLVVTVTIAQDNAAISSQCHIAIPDFAKVLNRPIGRRQLASKKQCLHWVCSPSR